MGQKYRLRSIFDPCWTQIFRQFRYRGELPFYSLALLCLELGRLYFSPLLSSPVCLLSPGPRPPPSQSFIFVVPPGAAGGRQVRPGAAGCRRAPPQKSLFFIGFSYIGVPKSLKIGVFSMFFEQDRWKSLKIVVFLLFFEQIRPKSLKIVVFLLFFVHFPSNIAKNCDYI